MKFGHIGCLGASLLGVFLVGFSAAVSAQVTLFDAENLQGGKLTVRVAEPSLGDSDFKDRAQSLVVRSGTWEICREPEFRGDCMRLAPGEYRNLDRRFSKGISSLRPLDGGNPIVYQGTGAPAQQPTAVLVIPQQPSSCRIGPTDACSGCNVTCTAGKEASCKPGSGFAAFAGNPAECKFQAVCQCK